MAKVVTERTLMSGNQAVARGAYEAGVLVAAGYPGTPSTEVLEALAGYPEVRVGWSANEKVALDTALGASLGGARALATMKHVGLNVAADTFMTAAYTGVSAGLVVVTADDPGMWSSQNEQDNRLYARFALVPMVEPADSAEARAYTRLAFDLSEEFDVPVLVRYTTRVAHTRGVVTPEARQAAPVRGFVRNPQKYVMLPAHAQRRHPLVLERYRRLQDYVETSPLTQVELGDRRVGIVTAGVVYQYVRELLPEASVLKLGMSFPLPLSAIRAFAAQVERLLVVEELEPLVEDALRAAGLAVEGKAYFPRVGELTPELVAAGLLAAGVLPGPLVRQSPPPAAPPARPPVLCPGCPHTVPFYELHRMGAVVCGDIGCYTLAALAPLAAMDSCIAMGSSIGMATGLSRSGGAGGPVVAAIGDSTFLHGGIPALVDAVYNDADITVLLLDNGTTAMTGGQPHPGTGVGIRGNETRAVDIVQLCRAVGVDHVEVVDPYDVPAVRVALAAAVAHAGPAVVITNRPCVEAPTKVRDLPFAVVAADCIACQLCMDLGCPALTWTDGWYDGRRQVAVDAGTCTGCTVCAQMCPAGAIVPRTAAGEAIGRA